MNKVKAQTAGVTEPKRVESGVPAGGQFAADLKAPGTPVLSGAALSNASDALAAYCTPQEFAAMTASSAQYWQNRYAQKGKSTTVDVDDIAQETMLRVLTAVAKGLKITDFRQMVSSTAANVTVRNTENVFRADDRKAYRLFDAERTRQMHELKRSLTQVEEDKIAKDVLDNWDKPRHRPSKDFRTPRTTDLTIFGGGSAEGGQDMADTLMASEGNGTYIETGSYMDRAHLELESVGAAHKAQARRLAWNALAESVDVPLARSGSLSQRQVTKHRTVIANYKKDDAFAENTDILAACDDWSNGMDNEATAAMFAPFGDLNIEDQEKVVMMLERFGEDRAHAMWQSALGFANNKHAEGEAA